ncbi:hypothetical protein [Roseomonas sp. 18066]|uniref:hypothetical protein n=1 Tax=Roseomonas sp. 18066 TaxID=2681412 RepID=UPI00190F6767|nr:hypothetical protein [Roseomonas sp. 18066]
MRKMLMLGAGALLLGASGLAVAQTATPPAAPQGQAATPPPPPPGGPMGGPGGPGRPPGPPPRFAHGGPDGGPGFGHRPPPPPRGASFKLERGETSISVRCAENETMQACVTAASALLDKMNSVSR